MLGPLAATSIGAVFPEARSEALYLLDRYTERLPRRANTLEMRIALAHLQSCHAEAQRLLGEGLFERAYAVAMRCDDKVIATQSLLQLGRYAEAALQLPLHDHAAYPLDRYELINLAMIALIGAGQWGDAAAIADQRAVVKSQYDREPGRVEDRCLGDLFRAYGGDASALDRVRSHAQDSPGCAEIAETATGRDGMLVQCFNDTPAEVGIPVPSHRWTRPIAALDWYEDSPVGREFGSACPWLARFAPPSGARAHPEWMAVYHAFVGDVAAVRHDIVALHRAIGLGDTETATADLELELKIHLGEPIEPDVLEHLLAIASDADPDVYERDDGRYRTTKDLYLEYTSRHRLEDTPTTRRKVGLWRAMLGDGEPLASTIVQDLESIDGGCGHLDDGVSRRELLAVLPRVVRHRGQLLAAMGGLPTARVDICADRASSDSFAWVQQAAMQRDLLRVAGDAAGAARWQTIIDGHARVLADRDRVIALSLWRRQAWLWR